MKLADARALRDKIKKDGIDNCIVPLGFGPDRYFARIYRATGPITGLYCTPIEALDFHSPEEYQQYRKDCATRLREERQCSRGERKAAAARLKADRELDALLLEILCEAGTAGA